MKKGILFVISGPSGAGKSTICKKILQNGDAKFSISCTTRAPRKGEKDGRDYYFISEEEFQKKVQDKEFLEYAKVHGHYYGTLKSDIIKSIDRKDFLLLDLDVKGGEQLRKNKSDIISKSIVGIFIVPPSMEELKNRLANRHTETKEQLKIRLGVALKEIEHHKYYDYVIVSSDRDSDLKSFYHIINAEKLKTQRQDIPKL